MPLNNSMNFMQNQNPFVNSYPNNYHPTQNIYQLTEENMNNNNDEDDEEDENTAEKINLNKNNSKKRSKFVKEGILNEEKIDPNKKKIKSNKVISELNENLENFHFEFSRQISKFI